MMDWHVPQLPFFDDQHYRLAEHLQRWRSENQDLASLHPEPAQFGVVCRKISARLADWGLLEYALPAIDNEGITPPDVRSLCLIREALAFDSFLVDDVFAMQGLGTAPLWHHPDTVLRDRYLEACRRGSHIAALALTEPDAGSDLAAASTRAERDGDHYVLNGSKAWISNAGIADHYIVVARTGEAPRARGLSAFLVDADTPGLEAGPQIELMTLHPIGNVVLSDCRVPAERMIGGGGQGFKSAMATFDVFRPSVGAAAVGACRRALAETLARVKSRQLFGRAMADMDGVQNQIADMDIDTEGAALMVYRAAWQADTVGGRTSREAAMAKLVATEAAHRVVDAAVQLHGAMGVAHGSMVEQLYRDVRPMRIYEGASEIQKMVIARSVIADG